MFSLLNQTVKLVSFNPRAELHGESKVPAADLKIELKSSNDVLSEFHPSLKQSFYDKPSDATQEELDINGPGWLPRKRFPDIGPIKLTKDFAGYTMTIHFGVSGASDIKLLDVALDGFRFDMQDGGTVVTTFRAIVHPEESEAGRLYGLVQREIAVSLIPPSESSDMFKEAA